ncbi:hypothetical protein D9615_007572 [Tricholomella constricta]|uniref:Uncharacterized protein n=1 Tax=Tricholomella constricta TaxID=117010 RepID=A0A8H5H744_9AGAR|nr:hypothetical protein D9615_007572 [Tricholomella constricta]
MPFQPIPPIAPPTPPVIGQCAFQELALLGNAPGPAIQSQLQHLVNQSNQIINHLQQLTNAVNNVTATMNRLPQQLYNSTASADNPLLYPQGVIVVPPMPTTKKELSNASAASCNATLVALGLNEPPANIPIAARRQSLMDYLGTATRA